MTVTIDEASSSKRPVAEDDKEGSPQKRTKTEDDVETASPSSSEGGTSVEETKKDNELFPRIQDEDMRNKLLKARENKNKEVTKSILCNEEKEFFCDCDCGVKLCQECVMEEGNDIAWECSLCEECRCDACAGECANCQEPICNDCAEDHNCD